MLLIYFLVVIFTLLTTLIQYKKVGSIHVWFGILALAFKAIYLQTLIIVSYVPNLGLNSKVLPSLNYTSYGFLLALILISIFDSNNRIQVRVAIKIPILVFLSAYLMEPKYQEIFGMGLILVGLSLLFTKSNILKMSMRVYTYFWLFYSLSLISTTFLKLPDLSLFFEFISFFFYYRVIQQLMAKYLIWKKLKCASI